jgi:hypothetical protein
VIYDIGDKITLSTVVRNDAGTAVNTPTLVIAVTKPDGTAVTPAPTVTNTAAGGVYTAPVTVDQSGVWTYVWTASGTVIAVEPGQFTVQPSRVLVASMEEFKAHLNRTDIADDLELRTHLTAATDWVEDTIGGPVAPTSYTETHCDVTDSIVPRKRPLISVTSITPYLGTALSTDAYRADTDLGIIYLRWSTGHEYTLVYRAGLSVIQERVKLGGLIVAAHLWETQNGFAGRRNIDEFSQTGLGFAVPNRARELLAHSTVGGVA